MTGFAGRDTGQQRGQLRRSRGRDAARAAPVAAARSSAARNCARVRAVPRGGIRRRRRRGPRQPQQPRGRRAGVVDVGGTSVRYVATSSCKRPQVLGVVGAGPLDHAGGRRARRRWSHRGRRSARVLSTAAGRAGRRVRLAHGVRAGCSSPTPTPAARPRPRSHPAPARNHATRRPGHGRRRWPRRVRAHRGPGRRGRRSVRMAHLGAILAEQIGSALTTAPFRRGATCPARTATASAVKAREHLLGFSTRSSRARLRPRGRHGHRGRPAQPGQGDRRRRRRHRSRRGRRRQPPRLRRARRVRPGRPAAASWPVPTCSRSARPASTGR